MTVELPSFDQILKQMEDCVLKIDHFEGIDKLPIKFEGVPNWRQMSSASHNVFGSAQPTKQGLEAVLDFYHKAGFQKVLWVSLRSEPVIYVGGQSFTPRFKNNTKVQFLVYLFIQFISNLSEGAGKCLCRTGIRRTSRSFGK